MISADTFYRTKLDRTWNPKLPRCAWVCLNPSDADASIDDPSSRKMVGFSARLGYGGYSLFNVMAIRLTNPSDLLRCDDPYGRDNTPENIARWCSEISQDAPIVAWGAIHKRFQARANAVLNALGEARCFGYTKDGNPRHPLMLAYSTPVQMFVRSMDVFVP